MSLNVNPFTLEEVAAVQAAYAAGALDVYTGTEVPLVESVVTGMITIDAGSGNEVLSARFTLMPPTDTIGAQRLLTPTAETYTLTLGQTRQVKITGLDSLALIMHAIGISDSTTYTGAAYVIGDTETDLADVIANDARLEWVTNGIDMVDVTLQAGPTAQTALLVVMGWYV